MNEEVTIQTVDQEGWTEIIRRLEGIEESPQQAYNLLFVTALLARNQGLNFEGFTKFMTTAWEVAGAVANQQNETDEEETQ